VCCVTRCSLARRIWFNQLICGVLLLQSCEVTAARESLSARSFSLLRSLPVLLSFALWFGFLLPAVRVFSACSGSCTLRDSSWLREFGRRSDLLLSCFPLLATVCFTLREFGQLARLGPAFKYTCLQFVLLPACHQSWSCSQLLLRIFVSCQEQASSASCASSES
jgi:hypothetical protein